MGISSYEVPRLIGRPARIDVFTTKIQEATQGSPPEFGVASALALALLAICLVAVYVYRSGTRDASSFATVTGKGYVPNAIALGRWRWPVALAVGAMFAVALGLPLATLLWQSCFANLAPPLLSSTAGATLANYQYILTYPIFLGAVRTSVLLAAMAATADRRPHPGDGVARPALRIAARLADRRARLRADRDPGRDRRRQHPAHLPDAADPPSTTRSGSCWSPT